MIAPTVVFFVVSLLTAVAALNRFLSFSRLPSIIFAIVVVVAIYIPISIAFLLPVDILSSNDELENQHNVFYLAPKYIILLWKINYWSAFVLMWALLPFFQEYYRSGEFTRINKVKDSIKRNLKFQLIVGFIGAVFLTYYFLKFGFHFQTFKSLLIALSHTYSLILSLWLMSHGLINVPKRRWLSNVNLDHQLEQLYLELPKIHDELNDTTYNYKDTCSTIKALEHIPGIYQSIYSKEVGVLIDSLPSDLEFTNHIRSTEYTSIDQLTGSNLTKLHATLKVEATNYRSDIYEFNKAVHTILRLQDIIDSKATRSLHFKHDKNYFRNGRLSYLIHVYLIPLINLIFAVFLFILSLIVIESEILHSTRFSLINLFLSTSKISSTGKFVISIIFLVHMVSCALISLTRIKIFKMYHLFPKNSNPVSVVFFTMYSNRLTIPLSYNFLTLLQSGKVHSQFNEFLGNSINLSILGGFFNENLPRIIIIPIILTTFNIFDKLKRKLSWDYFDAFESDDEDESDTHRRDVLIKQGKSIIQREFSASNSTNYRLNLNRSNNIVSEEPAVGYAQEFENSTPGTFNKIKNWFTNSNPAVLSIQGDEEAV